MNLIQIQTQTRKHIHHTITYTGGVYADMFRARLHYSIVRNLPKNKMKIAKTTTTTKRKLVEQFIFFLLYNCTPHTRTINNIRDNFAQYEMYHKYICFFLLFSLLFVLSPSRQISDDCEQHYSMDIRIKLIFFVEKNKKNRIFCGISIEESLRE